MHMRRGTVTAVTLLLLLGGAWADAEDSVEPGDVWLGVYLVDEVDGGIRIVAVVPGGPAALAGLRSGDLLIQAGIVELADQAALGRFLGARVAEQPLAVEVLRDGKPISLEVTPMSRVSSALARVKETISPEPPQRTAVRGWPQLSGRLGLEVVTITPELRRYYGAAPDRGVLVVRAGKDALGERAGVEVGDVVVGVGEAVVTRPAELELAVMRWNRQAPLTFGIVRDGNPLQVELAAPEAAPAPHLARPPLMSSDPATRRRLIEAKIDRLERQIQTLRQQLEAIKEPEPTPDR